METVDAIVKANELEKVKVELRILGSALITKRTDLQREEIKGTASPKEIAKIGKVQQLIDVLGRHGL